MEFTVTRQLQAETSEQIAIHLGRQQMVIFAHGIKELDGASLGFHESAGGALICRAWTKRRCHPHPLEPF